MALLRIDRLRQTARDAKVTAFVLACALLALSANAAAQEDAPPETPSAPPVQIAFTPPDLDGRVVLGIFDKNDRLVRTLRPQHATPELRIETNGYVTTWDGHDDAGNRCPGGRYAARGFIIGDEVEVRGEAYHFNDWVAEDGVPVTAVRLLPWNEGFWIEADVAGEETPRHATISSDGRLAWMADGPENSESTTAAPSLPVEPLFWTKGKDGAHWVIVEDEGSNAVIEISADGEALREFREAPVEPQPVEMAVSMDADAILLRELAKDGEVRLRLLRKTLSGADESGRAVSDWEVAFERSLQPCANFGLVDGALAANAGGTPGAVDIPLIPNALETRQTPLRISAAPSGDGSALFSPDGLELLRITVDGGWTRFALRREGNEVTLFQGNGVGVEEFSIQNVDHIARFDAGSFLLAPEEE